MPSLKTGPLVGVVGTRRIDGRVPFTICQHFPEFWHEVDTTSTRVCGWGGVGHVNVSCKLHTLLMFGTCQDVGHGVGWGMLTFLVGVNVPCTLHTLLMFCTCQDVGQGLGWGGAC